MTSHGQWTPGDLISTEPRQVTTASVVINDLTTLAQRCTVMRAAVACDDCPPGFVAEFLADLERAAGSLRRWTEPEPPIDEALRDATQTRAYGKPLAERGYFSNSGAGSPPPPVGRPIGDQS